MKRKQRHPRRLFKDSWRPEDKALESAEEEALERDYGDEIARARAERHRHTPAMAGFEKPRQQASPNQIRQIRRTAIGKNPDAAVR